MSSEVCNIQIYQLTKFLLPLHGMKVDHSLRSGSRRPWQPEILVIEIG